MQTDNLDIFKKIVFNLPSFKNTLAAINLLGVVYGVLMYLSIRAFTNIDLNAAVLPYLILFLFITPTLISGELSHRLLPQYPRKWSYFLAASNQLILFIYSLILSGANNLANAWSILWLGLITLYISNFIVLTFTLGSKYIKRISALSFVQPVAILIAFHIFLGRNLLVPIETYMMNIGVIVIATITMAIILYLMDYLLGSNVSNISASQLTSGMLQKEQSALDLGYPTKVDVQTLSITNKSEKIRLGIPWVHPGPIGGFGGGSLSKDIIESLNTDGKGFFFHVPSTHKSDPADPNDNSKIIEAIGKPSEIGKASRMIKKDYENAVFYGRKFNGQRIIFMDVPDYDDYEVSIFKEELDLENTAIVDLHQEDMAGSEKQMYHNTSIAKRLREDLRHFINELDKQSTENYRAGFDVISGQKPLFSLVEEVSDQRTLIFGIEGNGLTQNIRELEKEFAEEFDEVLAFSTDAHSSIHDLAKNKEFKKTRVRRSIDNAVGNLSNASIGLENSETDKIKLLQADYLGLIFSINIIVRLLPITLILLYIVLIVLVFFPIF